MSLDVGPVAACLTVTLALAVAALLCSGDADFDGVAPIASSVYCQKWKDGAVLGRLIGLAGARLCKKKDTRPRLDLAQLRR